MRKALLATSTLLLLPLLGAVRCDPDSDELVAKDCSVSYAGLHVEHGLVIDTVTPTCDVRPQQHTLQAQLEIQVGGQWVPQGRTVVTSARPDKTGFSVMLSAPCVEGEWRTSVHVDGVGPNGDGFFHDEAGETRHFSTVECAS